MTQCIYIQNQEKYSTYLAFREYFTWAQVLKEHRKVPNMVKTASAGYCYCFTVLDITVTLINSSCLSLSILDVGRNCFAWGYDWNIGLSRKNLANRSLQREQGVAVCENGVSRGAFTSVGALGMQRRCRRWRTHGTLGWKLPQFYSWLRNLWIRTATYFHNCFNAINPILKS